MKILRLQTVAKMSLLSVGLLYLTGCSESASDGGDNGKDSTAEMANDKDAGEDDEQAEQARKVFFQLPSPISTASVLKKAGATYNQELLNSVDNVSNYQTTEARALNLGIYGTDLSYSSIFEQTQPCRSYIKVSQQLAADLGISNAFNPELVQRFEANVGNRDSAMQLINEAFWNANSSLKESSNSNISSLIMAGGYVEGLYIGTHIVDTESPNPAILDRIAEQKYLLESLIQLIGLNESEGLVAGVKADLAQLKTVFDKVEKQPVERAENSVNEKGVTTIGAKTKLQITPEVLDELKAAVSDIRGKYVQ